MILKVSIAGLILVLIAIIVLSYYMNEEGFANITLSASESLVKSTSLTAEKAATAVTTATQHVTKVDAELAVAKAKADAATKAVATATDKTKAAALATQTAANKDVIAATKASTEAHAAATKAAADLQAASKAHTNALASMKALEAKVNEATTTHAAAAPYTMHNTPNTPNTHTDDANRITNPVSHPMGQPTVTLSDTGYAATELHQKAGLLQDIQKIVHNELLASRSTEPVHGGKISHSSSASISQGNEYNKASIKKSDSSCEDDEVDPPYNNSCPDMSQYIKKDSIPCAGCNLDY